jgi:hypothetical protein
MRNTTSGGILRTKRETELSRTDSYRAFSPTFILHITNLLFFNPLLSSLLNSLLNSILNRTPQLTPQPPQPPYRTYTPSPIHHHDTFKQHPQDTFRSPSRRSMSHGSSPYLEHVRSYWSIGRYHPEAAPGHCAYEMPR